MRSSHIACSLLLGFIARIVALRVATSAATLYYDYTLSGLQTFFSCLDYNVEATCDKLLPLLRNREHYLLAAYELARIDGARAEALVQHYLPRKEYWGWVFPYTLIINNRALDDLLPTDMILPSIHQIQMPLDARLPAFEARAVQRTVYTLLHAPILAGPGVPHLLAQLPEASVYWEIGSRDLRENPLRSAIFHLLDLQLQGRLERFTEGAPKDTAKVKAWLDLLNDPERWLKAFSKLRRYLSVQLKRERLTRSRQAYWHGLLLSRALLKWSLTEEEGSLPEEIPPEKAEHMERLLKSYLTAYGTKNIPYWSRVRLLQMAYCHNINFDGEPAIIAILDHTQRRLVEHGMIGGSVEARHMGWRMALYRARQRVIPPPTGPMDWGQFRAWWDAYDELSADCLLINPQFPHPIRVLDRDVGNFEEFLDLANRVILGHIVNPSNGQSYAGGFKMIVRVMFTNLLVHKTLGISLSSSISRTDAVSTCMLFPLLIATVICGNALMTPEYFELAIPITDEPIPVIKHYLQASRPTTQVALFSLGIPSQETLDGDMVRQSRSGNLGGSIIRSLGTLLVFYVAKLAIDHLWELGTLWMWEGPVGEGALVTPLCITRASWYEVARSRHVSEMTIVPTVGRPMGQYLKPQIDD